MPGQQPDGEWVLDLIHQGLLPLSQRTLLTARLVCRHWHSSLSSDITRITLPYDAWGTTSRARSSASTLTHAGACGAGPAQQDQTGWRSAATAAAAALAAVREEVGLEEAAEAQDGGPRRAKRNKSTTTNQNNNSGGTAANGHSAIGSKTSSTQLAAAAEAAAGPAAAGGTPCDPSLPGLQQLDHTHGVPAAPAQQHAAAAAVAAPAAEAEAPQGTAGSTQPAPLDVSQQQVCPGTTAAAGGAEGASSAAYHPLHLLPSSLPACTHVTLSNRRSVWYEPQAPCGVAAIRQAVELLAQLPKLHSLCAQGYMPAGDWQPLLSALAGNQQQQEQQEAQQEEQEEEQAGDGTGRQQQDDGMELDAAAAAAMPLPAEQHEQQQQQLQSPPPLQQQQESKQQQLAPAVPQQQQQQQQLALCTRLASLELQALELPPPLLLEGVLAGLSGLRSLTLHASMESIAEAAHLQSLATGTQLTALLLTVYQAAHSRCPLDPLMALTNLQHLEVTYGGIFNDQRPVLAEPLLMSRLVHLTALGSSGLAQPLLPQPNLTSLRSLRVAGLTKRLPESAVSLIGACSSPALQALRLEGGRRGIAAVAADQLDHLGGMTQLTCLSVALSKGGLPAGKSTQQLLKLSGLTSLQTLWLGSGDHRLGVSSEHLQALGQQWPCVDSLRLSGFSPLQGFAGLGAFTGLTALSMKPGVGTGKLLLELDVALQQLPLLRRLHLDFRSALTLEHVEAIAAACATRLQHLSLNMWAPGIGSRALVAIGQLSCLSSLQLMSVRAAVLSGPPGIAALREMPSLQLLCVQAADEVITEQRPLDLGAHLSEVLDRPLGPLREVRVWLGSGVEARQAEAGVAATVEALLPDCVCRVLKEPEKAIL